MIRLIISGNKTKALHIGSGIPSKLFINGREIEFINHHKYLGVYVGRRSSGHDMDLKRITTTLSERIRPLRDLALGVRGANPHLLRKLYIYFATPILDHSPSTIRLLCKTRI